MSLPRTLLLLILLSCAPISLAADQAASNSAAAFTADLYSHLAATRPPSQNLFFSPYSIRTALAMTATGAAGITKSQMLSVIDIPPTVHIRDGLALAAHTPHTPDADDLAVADGLWVQTGFAPRAQFAQQLRQDYAAPLRSVDFAHNPAQAVQQINSWIDTQTHHHIPEIATSFDAYTALVLTNAVYFKGTWQNRFEERATQPGPFHLTPQQDVQVPLMHQTLLTLSYEQTPLFQAVQLPYLNHDLRMVLLVPKSIDGLPALEKQMDANNLKRWLADFTPRLVLLTMPKFIMSDAYELSTPLKSMGMTNAFAPGQADFSGITSSPHYGNQASLYLSEVLHKTFVAVDEQGTVATAVTSVDAALGGAVQTPDYIELIADRPFLFFIMDQQAHTPLFMGRICDPTKS